MAYENKSNDIEYTRRSSQMVQSFGPGAMVDFKEQTLMTAAPEFWKDRIYPIYDRRLQKRLGVNYFGFPINKNCGGQILGLSYVRFPEWYYCKICHKFQSLNDWIDEHKKNTNKDPNMVNHLRCYNSMHQYPADLVCARFVSVCNCGHIDDFPWMEYVHKKYYAKTHNNNIDTYTYNIDKNGNEGQKKHSLTMRSLRMSGPEGIQITCSCGATANMTGVFREDALKNLEIKCTGRHPWKFNSQYTSNCVGKARAILRGASSVYFPVCINSIVIPQKAEDNYRRVVETDLYKQFFGAVQNQINSVNQNVMPPSAIQNDIQVSKKKISSNKEELEDKTDQLNEFKNLPLSLQQTFLSTINSIGKEIQQLENNIKAEENHIEQLKNQLNNPVVPNLNFTNIYDIFAGQICDFTQIPKNEVTDILRETIEIKPTSETDDFSYKEYEYKALSGETQIKESKYFTRVSNDENPFSRYEENGIPNFIKNVSLIKNLREVQALIGFSRLKPISFSDSILNNQQDSTTNLDESKMVFIKEYTDKWYPGSEVIGEGIFVEFNYDLISQWAKTKTVLDRVKKIDTRFKNSLYGRSSMKQITPGFILLHTISHLLLNQLSFECGYNVASLKERIYYSDCKKKSGILIYTANGDSEGSLGGLVRQGMFDVFPFILSKAMDSAKFCSNDPVCSCSSGQGRDSFNLAACHSCVLLPETCCEEFNGFLDRGLLVGTLDSEDFGFLTYCGKND